MAKNTEAKEGEFTLIYNGSETAHPVALTREQHEALQVLINTLPGEKLNVLAKIKVEYCR